MDLPTKVHRLAREDIVAPAPDRPLRDLAREMYERNVGSVVIVDEDGGVAGIPTPDDVVVHLAGESTHVSAQFDNVAGVIRSESPGR